MRLHEVGIYVYNVVTIFTTFKALLLYHKLGDIILYVEYP